MIRYATLALSLALPLAASAAELPVGQWARGDGNARVSIAPCGEALCATNTFIKDTSEGEAVGDKLVMNVKPSGAGKLAGKAYDPKRERSYSITITFDDASMSTRGCIIGVLCKTVQWSRLD